MCIRLNNIMFLQLFMLFNTRVLEFWVIKTTNIYDFLHLLSLLKSNLIWILGGGIYTYLP
jgi:hypothetical protein